MLSVGLANFKRMVLDSPEPVLVDFYAEWCGPCQQLKPLLRSIDDIGHKVVTVDIVKEPELAEHYKVEALPTLMTFKGGQPVSTKVGIATRKEIMGMFAAA